MFSRGRVLLGAVALMVASLMALPAASSAQSLEGAVGVDGITKHLKALQRIANQNDGNRASGLPGYDASVKYVRQKLRKAGYETSTQTFDFDLFEEQADAELEQLTPTAKTYTEEEFTSAEFSGSGEVTGTVTPVDVQVPPGAEANSSTSGCEAEDFASFPEGNIALIQRGTCDFGLKAQNADDAGASGVILFNEGQEGRTDLLGPTLGDFRPSIPVVGTTYAVGEEFATASSPTARISVTSTITPSTSKNVIADTKRGRENRTVVVGAHLDSVPEGPGINDNGSGSAQNLEMALQMAKLKIKPRNQVRFAFWGAEESGLNGSNAYVAELSNKEARAIDLNLNFDMVGSPNFARFVYDGDGSEFGAEGPAGSDAIERSFERAFAAKDLATEPTEFDGRSDYLAFIEAGIPAGGLFSGAEGVKTEEQVDLYGGTAGEAYDSCYHQECDDIDNVSNKALNQFSNAAAEVTFKYAQRKAPLGGNESQAARASASKGAEAEYLGNHEVR